VSDGLQEISSADATSIVDAAAMDLLQELNRIKRRYDLFPPTLAVGILLTIAIALSSPDWPLGIAALIAITALTVAARHHDVTHGTAILNYSLGQETETAFSNLQAALRDLATSQRLWHLDAEGYTSDWKRNAGASSLLRKSDAESLLAVPPRIVCNLNVPTLRSKWKSLYFFPDRLLVYDRTGIGAVPYSAIQPTVAQTRFIEAGAVPTDSPAVGSTWRFVNKRGGPDRRFNNNRQLPILSYGELHLSSNSGLNEVFQCSSPAKPIKFAAEILAFGKTLDSVSSSTSQAAGGISFESLGRDTGQLSRVALWVAVGIMGVISLVLFSKLSPQSLPADTSQAQAQIELARQQFAASLSQALAAKKYRNVSVLSANDSLSFTFTGEGPKAARRDGLVPFNKQAFLKRFVEPKNETDLCSEGFTKLQFSVNRNLPSVQTLDCVTSPNSQTSSQ
jgi:type II secretory pathway pseudopilin PulG